MVKKSLGPNGNIYTQYIWGLFPNIITLRDFGISNIFKYFWSYAGMKKMVVNHIDKTFVTSDAATILKELEVQHPAAKMVVMASKMQEN